MSESTENISKKRDSLLVKYELQKISEWERAYTERTIEDIEAQNNVLIIAEKLIEWSKALKPGGKREQVISRLLKACNRILAFLITKETTLSKMTVEMMEYRKLYKQELENVKTLKDEIKVLKEEIEFHEETKD